MTGVAGLLENFSYYYEKILIQSSNCLVLPHQRNKLYELYRMAEAFYHNVLEEAGLTQTERKELNEKFASLTRLVVQIQEGFGDWGLQAV